LVWTGERRERRERRERGEKDDEELRHERKRKSVLLTGRQRASAGKGMRN
jgi:hypothetical protein